MTDAPLIEPEMPKAYDPKKVEDKWYQFWLKKNYFRAEVDHNKKPFTIIMPPTNITGELHVGHGLTMTLEDIMIRWHRMKGEPTLWLPGFDHAGIATQVVVERVLASEGTDRHKLGRKKFEERVWQWARDYLKTIREQKQKLGCSADWSRERFTMDEGPSKSVRTAFVNLYDKGLIYKGERIINWCPRCLTAISDLEVDHKDLTGNLWYVRYPYEDGSGYITVATTRPETILGDTAVAVNPDDERYKDVIGKKVILPAVKRVIPIIADEAVSLEFGTGAVKVTPAHDPVDFEIAQRHHLPLIQILNDNASMNGNAGPYKGLDRFACRKAIVADLERDSLLVKIEPYSHAVGHCQRCGTIVEPLASKQWFVTMKPLAQPAIEAVRDGRIIIVPERFNKIYFQWMENIRDWCISRQLWWGHRIPVWYCKDCGKLTVAVEPTTKCQHCQSKNIEQDPDVLDTWFSSALWTHSTLGWPDDTTDMRYFYPSTVMETGYDILFFWVARMIMMGLEDTGNIPFQTVYLHGLVRDEKGEKMSKTRGNVRDPIDIAAEFGTDAMRCAFLTGLAPGADSKLTDVKLENGRNFANKLWNATRFVVKGIPDGKIDLTIKYGSLPTEDRWILSRLNRTIAKVNKMMDDFQLGEALKDIYEFLWSEYCDWYIEMAKTRLRPEYKGTSPLPVLIHVLETSLRLLHPFMPFVTEELWQNLKYRLPAGWRTTDSIMVADYPVADEKAFDDSAEQVMTSIIEIVRAIRNARSENKVAPNRWVTAEIYGGGLAPAIIPYTEAMQTLARAKPLTFHETRLKGTVTENAVVSVLTETDVVIPIASMVDMAAEKERLQKEIGQLEADITRLETRLKDESFLGKAPAAVVNKEKERLAERKDRLARLKQQAGF
ncbi:MAG: valine--tRNA ligase [Dehalococcoidia bacterium]|nr:valine--tRNA ligase [Dehalococcoidia bacterium]